MLVYKKISFKHKLTVPMNVFAISFMYHPITDTKCVLCLEVDDKIYRVLSKSLFTVDGDEEGKQLHEISEVISKSNNEFDGKSHFPYNFYDVEKSIKLDESYTRMILKISVMDALVFSKLKLLL